MSRCKSRFKEYLSKFGTNSPGCAGNAAHNVLVELTEKWKRQDRNRKNRRKSVGGKRY